MAVLFSIFCILGALGGGNMFQANQAHAQITNVVGEFPGWITGHGLCGASSFAVIVGGLKSIAKVTEKVVPIMGVLYVLTALVILLMNANMIGWAFGEIFRGAFTGAGVAGGMVGALIQGFKRAAFSNEAGVGSAAIAHSAVKTKEPITEGFVSLLEPFIDTVVICTMTALVIIITGQLVMDANTGMYLLDEGANTIADGGRQQRRGPDLGGLLIRGAVLPVHPGDCGDPVRLLDHDQLVLLRAQGLDLPLWRGRNKGAGFQSDLLHLRCHWCGGQPWSCH